MSNPYIIYDNEYYNAELKERFISKRKEELSTPVNYIDTCFRKISETENELGKDLSNWSFYEIVDYYKILNSSSFETLTCLNSLLSIYTQFCIENGLVQDNQNHYLECRKDILLGCLNKAKIDKRMVDRETVLGWVRELPNPKDQFILLSVFEYGRSNNYLDIVRAKPKDLNGNILKLSNRNVKISDELRNIIYNCIDEDTYYSISSQEKREVPLIDKGYIIKWYPNQRNTDDRQQGRSLYQTCVRELTYLGINEWMNPSAIETSGKIHMINQQAKVHDMSANDYIYSEYKKEVENQYDFKIQISSFLKKYKEYLA